jgi:precorrin-6B methylase 2
VESNIRPLYFGQLTRRFLCVLLGLCAIAVAAGSRADAQTEQTRESWQRVTDLFSAAHVGVGAHVADVGAGDGFLTVRLSSAVGPGGRVYAVDIDEKVLNGLRRRLDDADVANVDVVVGGEDDPHLPADSLDAAFIVNAYHEMPGGVAVLQRVLSALKPGGRLVLCEPVPRTANQTRAAQMSDHVLDPLLILEDLRGRFSDCRSAGRVRHELRRHEVRFHRGATAMRPSSSSFDIRIAAVLRP